MLAKYWQRAKGAGRVTVARFGGILADDALHRRGSVARRLATDNEGSLRFLQVEANVVSSSRAASCVRSSAESCHRSWMEAATNIPSGSNV